MALDQLPLPRLQVAPSTALALNAQGAGTVASALLGSDGAKGVVVVVNQASHTGTPSTTVTIQGYDVASGQTWTILASAAITADGVTVLRVYPGLTAVANATVSDVLPPVFKISVTVNGTTPAVTMSVGVGLIP